MSPPKVDFLDKAQSAWGDAMPPEVKALAIEANRTTSARAAKRIGYSPAVVSHLFVNRYPGDIGRVFTKIRGALMGETVTCPVVGEIGIDRCLAEQKMGNTGASSIRAALYRACRGGCPHSRINPEGDDAGN